MSTTCLVLMAHGSRDPRWRAPFEALATTLGSELAQPAVRLAYMEFIGPTLEDVAAQAVDEGYARLRVLPLFMAGGGHVDRDIPAQVVAIKQRFPGLEIDVLPPIGEHPRMVALIKEIVSESAT